MSSINAISGLLTEEQKETLLSETISKLYNSPDQIVPLKALLSDPHFEALKPKFQQRIETYCLDLLEKASVLSEEGLDGSGPQTEDVQLAVLLGEIFPSLNSVLVQSLTSKLAHFLGSTKLLPNDVSSLVSSTFSSVSEDSVPPARDQISVLLDLLEQLLSKIEIETVETHVLNTIACCGMLVPDENAADAALRITRWTAASAARDRSLDMLVWKTVFCLLSDTTIKKNARRGCVFWVRYLNAATSADCLTSSDIFKKSVKEPVYWSTIQKLLVHPIHEYRKYGLAVLQFSTESLTESFENGVMKWDVNLRSELITEWNRYFVLYEIVGIDTSLHQVEAGMNDIQSLLDPQKTLLASSWGLCLISTAIQATMDLVRKFGLAVVLDMAPDKLVVFDATLAYFLREVFLKFAMLAPLFAIEEEPKTGVSRCVHGEKLSLFIENVFKALQKEKPLHIPDVLSAVLNKLCDDREAYDFARIYLLTGLYKGLVSATGVVNKSHLVLLERLYPAECETNTSEQFVQKLYLRLLSAIDSKSVSLPVFIHHLGRFVQANNGKNNTPNYGYKLFDAESDLILDFIIANYPPNSLLSVLSLSIGQLSIEEISICVELISAASDSLESIKPLELVILLHPVFPLVLVELTYSGLLHIDPVLLLLQKYYAKLIEELTQNLIKHQPIWQRAQTIANYPVLLDENDENTCAIPLKKLWVAVAVEFQSTSKEVVELAIHKLRFFAALCHKERFLRDELWLPNIEDTFKLSGYFFKRLDAKDFDYRYYDETYALYYAILLDVLETTDTSDELLAEALKIVAKTSTLGDYKAQTAALRLLIEVFLENNDNSTPEILDIFEEIWESITAGKLRLNQLELYSVFLDAVFHKKVLSLCVEDPNAARTVNRIAKEVVDLAHARRSLVPKIAYRLRCFQTEDPEGFASTSVFADLLLEIYIHKKLKAKAFRMVPVVTRLYDRIISYGAGNLYTETYGTPEKLSRALVAAILASLPKGSVLGAYLFDFIVKQGQKKYNLFNPARKVDSNEEWIRVQIYSLLLILVLALDTKILEPVVDSVILPALSLDASPLVRVYIEWIIALVYSKNLDKIDEFFAAIGSNPRFNPALVMAYERILFMVCRELSPEVESQYLLKFLTILISYCASDKAILRHFSCSLMCCVKKELDDKPHLVISEAEKSLVNKIYSLVTLDGKILEYRHGDAMLWSVSEDLTLVAICGGVLMKISDRAGLDVLTENDFKEALPTTSGLTLLIGHDETDIWLGKRLNRIKTIDLGESKLDMVALQKKSGGWRSVMDVDADASGNSSSIKRSKLIVMGSLVDKPPNLGGICRLCDVLGAGLLTIGDDKYKETQAFKSVAVTADLWLPMLEVRPENIIEYMRAQKASGYTIIGLEQTDQSVELNYDLKFPEKSLIVLGKEKEGIPGDILAELDFAVEIKQVGMIRLMNIQTATALIVHAYSLQHC